jgi:Xaa-Pro aminopeptidase
MGYAPFYTHRLGHGLGLEMHEHPYLNGANDEKLRAGVVATNEPVSCCFELLRLLKGRQMIAYTFAMAFRAFT